MSRTHKGRKFREFSMLNERYVNHNYLKYYKLAKRDICSRHDVTENELECMLFMYDYEFFTKNHISKAPPKSQKVLRGVINPSQRGMIERIYYRTDLEKGRWSSWHFSSTTRILQGQVPTHAEGHYHPAVLPQATRRGGLRFILKIL